MLSSIMSPNRDQKHTLICTMEHYIVNTDKYSELLFSCDMCETEIIIMVRKALTCFTNILLNDYNTAQSDKVSTTGMRTLLNENS